MSSLLFSLLFFHFSLSEGEFYVLISVIITGSTASIVRKPGNRVRPREKWGQLCKKSMQHIYPFSLLFSSARKKLVQKRENPMQKSENSPQKSAD
jgi:hypothetical protein